MTQRDESDILDRRWVIVGTRELSQPVVAGPFVTELAALEWFEREQPTRNGALYAMTVVELVLPVDLPDPVPYVRWRATLERLKALRA